MLNSLIIEIKRLGHIVWDLLLIYAIGWPREISPGLKRLLLKFFGLDITYSNQYQFPNLTKSLPYCCVCAFNRTEAAKFKGSIFDFT